MNLTGSFSTGCREVYVRSRHVSLSAELFCERRIGHFEPRGGRCLAAACAGLCRWHIVGRVDNPHDAGLLGDGCWNRQFAQCRRRFRHRKFIAYRALQRRNAIHPRLATARRCSCGIGGVCCGRPLCGTDVGAVPSVVRIRFGWVLEGVVS